MGRNADTNTQGRVMSDTLPTVWPIEPHTEAKHAILDRYLKAWLPILTRQAASLKRQYGSVKSHRILYIDGFAGPGVYKDGEPGSPLIAIDAAVKHSEPFPFRVEMLFIEERPDRYSMLSEKLLQKAKEIENTRQNVTVISPQQGDCDVVLGGLLDRSAQRGIHFGPALAFLDQFGYGSVSMRLISKILAVPQCEVFTYLDYKDINRFITDSHKAPALDRAFGGDEWKECISLPERQRRSRLLELYTQALRDPGRGGAKYVVPFLMHDRRDQPLFWLIFATNHLRGLEEMKRAMWSVDKSGNFKFSDKDDPSQLKLLDDSFDQQWLADELKSSLNGQTLTAQQVFEHVLVHTPCYLFKTALQAMERDGRITIVNAPNGRRNFSFPDKHLEKITVRFRKDLI